MISDRALGRVLPASGVALFGDLIRWSFWALVFILWVTFLTVYSRMIRLALADPSHTDFTIFYYTGRLIADGRPMYGQSPAAYGVAWTADHLGNLNPPHFQALVLPLAYLSYSKALIAWVSISLACLVASLAVIAHELQVTWSWPRFWLWGAVILSSAAFTTVAVTCELTFLLMLPFTLSWRAWRSGRWMAAGAWLGACASVKLFLLLFLPWLAWRRQWRALFSFVFAGAVAVAAGLSLFGAAPYRLWLQTLSRATWVSMSMNASWEGFITRIIQGGSGLTPLAAMPEWLKPLLFGGALLLAVATLAVLAAQRRSSDREVLVLLLGALLSSPLGWVYYLPLGLGPLLGWLGAGSAWTGARVAGTASVVLVVLGLIAVTVPQELTMAGQPSGMATLTIGSAYFWGVLSIWMAAARARTT